MDRGDGVTRLPLVRAGWRAALVRSGERERDNERDVPERASSLLPYCTVAAGASPPNSYRTPPRIPLSSLVSCLTAHVLTHVGT